MIIANFDYSYLDVILIYFSSAKLVDNHCFNLSLCDFQWIIFERNISRLTKIERKHKPQYEAKQNFNREWPVQDLFKQARSQMHTQKRFFITHAWYAWKDNLILTFCLSRAGLDRPSWPLRTGWSKWWKGT